MNRTIVNAIHHKRRLTFHYNGYQRIVEPHTYGKATTGRDSLSAYQIKGGHASGHDEPWRLFTVSKMLGPSLSGDSFSRPRPGYKRGDRIMQFIYAEL